MSGLVTNPSNLQLPTGNMPSVDPDNNQARIQYTNSSVHMPDLSLNYAYGITFDPSGDITSETYDDTLYNETMNTIYTGKSLLRTNRGANTAVAGAVCRFACQNGIYGGMYEYPIAPDPGTDGDKPSEGAGNVSKGDIRGFSLMGVGYNADPSANDYVSLVMDTSGAGVLIQTIGKYWLVQQNFYLNNYYPTGLFDAQNSSGASVKADPLVPMLPIPTFTGQPDTFNNPSLSGSVTTTDLSNAIEGYGIPDGSGGYVNDVPGAYSVLFENTFERIAPTSCAMNGVGGTFVSYGYYVDPSINYTTSVYYYANSGTENYATSPNTITESIEPVISVLYGDITSIVIEPPNGETGRNSHLYALDISNNKIYSLDLGTEQTGKDASANDWKEIGAPSSGKWGKICINPNYSGGSDNTNEKYFMYVTSPGTYWGTSTQAATEALGNGTIIGIDSSMDMTNILGDASSNNQLYRPGNICADDAGHIVVMVDMFSSNANLVFDESSGIESPIIPGNMYRLPPPSGSNPYSKTDGSGNVNLTYYGNNGTTSIVNDSPGLLYPSAPVWMSNHKSTFIIPYYYNATSIYEGGGGGPDFGGEVEDSFTGVDDNPVNPDDFNPDTSAPSGTGGTMFRVGGNGMTSIIGKVAPSSIINSNRIQYISPFLDFCTPFTYDLSYGVLSDPSYAIYAMCPVVNNPNNASGTAPTYSSTGTTTKTQYLYQYKWSMDPSGAFTFFEPAQQITSFSVSIQCMRKGTSIACFRNNRHAQVPIEEVKVGTLVKTNKHGYKKVTHVRHTDMKNVLHLDQLSVMYCMTKDKHSELTDDLYLTGGHSILLDQLTDDEHAKMHSIDWPNHFYEVHGKKKLLAMHSNNFEAVVVNDIVYNIVLEQADDRDDFYSYGIYANGCLIESCNKASLGAEHVKDTSKIFQDVATGHSTNFYTPRVAAT